jgi:hypothetical protein
MSWREIDKARSGGGGRGSTSPQRSGGGPRTGGRSTEDPHSKQYRAALEAAFAKGELGKLADKLNLLGRGNPADEANRPAPPPAVTPQVGDKPSLSDRMVATAERVVAPVPAPGASPEAVDDAAKKKVGGKKKAGEDRPSLLRKLLEAPSRHEISKAAEKYLSRFPMPDDHEFLEQLLEHEQNERIKEALSRITQLLDRRLPPRRTRALIGKLRYLTETNSEDAIRETAQTLLSRLS